MACRRSGSAFRNRGVAGWPPIPVTRPGERRLWTGLTKKEKDARRQFQNDIPDIHCALDEKSGALLYRNGLEIAPPGFGQTFAKLTRGS